MAGQSNLTITNYNAINASITNLEAESPEIGENGILTTAITELESYSTAHDNFLDSYISELEISGGGLAAQYMHTNGDYTTFIGSLQNAISSFSAAEGDGSVTNSEGLPTTQARISSSSIPGNAKTSELSFKKTESTTTDSELSKVTSELTEIVKTPTKTTTDNTSSNKASFSQTPKTSQQTIQQEVSSTEGVSTSSTSPSSLVEGTVAVATGGLGATALSSETGSSSILNNLSTETQNELRNHLKELGFGEDEINSIMNGEISIPQSAVDAMGDVLEKTLATNPELRNSLKEQYGLDIFNEDGSINKENLKLILLMDHKNQNDTNSIVDLIQNKYGIDIVNQETFTNLTNKLEQALAKDANLRNTLKKQYGFDIFNENGTVNKDNLVLAMLMDDKDLADSFDLANLLKELYDENSTVESILSNVVKPTTKTNVKQSGMGSVPFVAAGLGLTGTIGGGVAIAAKEKKSSERKRTEEKLEEEKLAQKEKEKQKEQQKKEDDKEWLLGLGLGLAGAGLAASNQDDEEKEE